MENGAVELEIARRNKLQDRRKKTPLELILLTPNGILAWLLPLPKLQRVRRLLAHAVRPPSPCDLLFSGEPLTAELGQLVQPAITAGSFNVTVTQTSLPKGVY